MIHSLSGGIVKDEIYFNLAYVEILSGEDAGKHFWYKYDIFMLAVGDIVLVPLKDKKLKGRVTQINACVNSKSAPMPSRQIKYILEKIC